MLGSFAVILRRYNGTILLHRSSPRTRAVLKAFFSDNIFESKERAEERIWIAEMEKQILEETRMKARRADKASKSKVGSSAAVKGAVQENTNSKSYPQVKVEE